jgi:hypothetical protein
MKAQDVVIAVMREVEGLAKRDKNTAQGFNFRGIDAVMNAVGPALRKHGGFVLPRIMGMQHETMPSKNGGTLNVVRLNVDYSVYGDEGDPITGSVAAEAFDSGDKATAKAMSVAYRTFLLQLLCLPTDEIDPDAQNYELAEVKARDWDLEVAALTTIDNARKLYAEARGAKAGAKVLKSIESKVAELAPAAAE